MLSLLQRDEGTYGVVSGCVRKWQGQACCCTAAISSYIGFLAEAAISYHACALKRRRVLMLVNGQMNALVPTGVMVIHAS